MSPSTIATKKVKKKGRRKKENDNVAMWQRRTPPFFKKMEKKAARVITVDPRLMTSPRAPLSNTGALQWGRRTMETRKKRNS